MFSTLLCRPGAVSARSVFDGLELVESEKGDGVEIVSLEHSSPAAKATLQVGDRITRIGRYGIRNLDDYVKVSRRIKKQGSVTTLEYYRDGVCCSADLSLYSAQLKMKWGVEIIPWRKETAPGKEDNTNYWLKKAAGLISKNKNRNAADRSPEDYGKVILTLFTALEASPDSLSTATLIAGQYGELASLYYGRGEKKKAVWCLKRALRMYGNSLRKAGDIHDLSLIKNGLGELRESVAKLQ